MMDLKRDVVSLVSLKVLKVSWINSGIKKGSAFDK